ncbi:epidermal retinol dehydrogenase 2-like [Aphomia sociella]
MGRGLAQRFNKLGSTVICVDINSKSNKETIDLLKSENPKAKVHKYECDVTNRAAVFELASKVQKEIGTVSILVNNAGIMPCNPFLEQTEQEIRLMMDINVNGYLWMMQAFLPEMISRNHGHILSMASMAGVAGVANLVPYCGSKFAVRGIMEALATELYEDSRPTDGIKLTTVCPIMVNTGLCKNPRNRFKMLNMVEADDAADMIMNAIRREYTEITIPSFLYYTHKYLLLQLPRPAILLINQFFNSGVDPHGKSN